MMLLLADDSVHGYRLHQELHARGLAMQPASMYRRLRMFEVEGSVTSRWSDPITGPRRHVYELTAEGRATLHELSGLIAATRDNYGAFVHAYERTSAQRAEDGGDDDEPRGLASGEHDPAAAMARAMPDTPPPARLRPHAELLAGWLLLRLEVGETHGYDLHRDMDDAHRLATDPGTVYRMLRRFDADGWVQSRWTKSAGGPRRRVYRLTATGQRNLEHIADLIATIRNTFDTYLSAYHQRCDDGFSSADDSSTPA